MKQNRWVVLFAILLLPMCRTASTSKKTVPNPRERLVRGSAGLIEHPFDGEQIGEGNFLQRLIERYIRPRAYPKHQIDLNRRRRAYENLVALRKQTRRPHVSTEWRSGRRGPSGPGGPGGGPGGAGTPGSFDPNGCAWYAEGPTNINGRVTSIAIDPKNRDRIFIATVGGVWRSSDRGRRWQRVTDDFFAPLFSTVAINAETPSEVYAGTGDPNYYFGFSRTRTAGIWRSTSSGDPGTWTKVSSAALDTEVIYRLMVDPVAPHDVYAATSSGAYIGSDSGGTMTWTRIGNFDASTNDIAVDFGATPHKVYACARVTNASFAAGVWKWDGSAWTKSDSGVPTASIETMRIALAPSDAKRLYLKVSKQGGHLQGIYKSIDGAATWSDLPAASALDDSGSDANSFWYSWYNNVIEVDPSDAQVVYAGGLNFFRTTDGGDHWDKISGGADSQYPHTIHGDQHAIAFDPVNPKIVYSGNDGGIDRTTDMSAATWHWEDIAHGLTLTEFYDLTSMRADASIRAGGSQDNGTDVSYGNRTWYNPGGCDGFDVAFDAQNSSTLYANCNGGLFEIVNTIPGTDGFAKSATWVSPAKITPGAPVITDPSLAGAALASSVATKDGGDICGAPQILRTTDGINWSSLVTTLTGAYVTSMAIAPSSSFQRYYVGLIYLPPDPAKCAAGTPFDAAIWRTADGGKSWLKTNTGLPPANWPIGLAVDPKDEKRAFVASNDVVSMTTDGGEKWVQLGSAVGAYIAKIVVDPFDANTLYVATDVGVLKATITTAGGAATASFVPFDEGLPDGLDVNDIAVNPNTGILTIGSMGHAAFSRNISPSAVCTDRALLVRDNVFDRGFAPSPSDVPNPENPVPDPARPDFYKPDDSPGGKLYWWTSNDIRIDVPSADAVKNQFTSVDHVEFDSCPITVADCPAGTLRDSAPLRGLPARGYVQVTNRGLKTIDNVRVIALWTDATTAVPLLPDTFWSKTFPKDGGCGALDESTGWHFVDTKSPCKTIPLINPDMPEVTRFDWKVPADAPPHACFLTIVESPDDPLDAAIRANNELRVWELVPNQRQISQRNLHPIDPPPGSTTSSMMETVDVPNPTGSEGVELFFTTTGVEAPIRVILPSTRDVQVQGLDATRGATAAELRLVRQAKLDPAAIFTVPATGGSMRLPIRPGERWRIGIVASATGRPGRVSVVAKQGNTILGGSTYLLRSGRP
ncbi:MAG: hypothetical protein M3Q69_17210 [Acidobacteriota bacterium]|nr:hypothetical protein [Acidobacteriota bacterium]